MTLEEKLQPILTQVFGSPPPADPHVPRTEVAGWTSVAHLNLVLELEDAFDVRLEVEDIEGLGSVSDIVATLERLGAQ